MKEFEKFHDSVITAMRNCEIFHAYFDLTKINTQDRKIAFIVKIAEPFFDIRNTLYRLNNIESYINWSPRTKEIYCKFDLLLYHLEHHIQEIYILKERLISFINILKKVYKKYDSSLIESFSKLQINISSQLKDFTNERSTHVHSKRYSNESITKANIKLTLLSLENDNYNDLGSVMLRDEYLDLKKELIMLVRSKNNKVQSIINKAFKDINDSLLLEDGNLYIPKNYLTTTSREI